MNGANLRRTTDDLWPTAEERLRAALCSEKPAYIDLDVVARDVARVVALAETRAFAEANRCLIEETRRRIQHAKDRAGL